MAQIEVKALHKRYQRKVASEGRGHIFRDFFKPVWQNIEAIDNINFDIDPGEMIGYVGPNGSGKSTTVKLLSGILTPDSGTITVAGRIPTRDRMRNNREIGVVFGQRSSLWWDVPIIESYRLLRILYDIPQKRFNENLAMLSSAMGLKDLLPVPERQLSLGQKMRCNIAAALLHDPKIVFLDEPTVGIDAATKTDIRQLIRTINIERQTTFIITSHDFQDIEALCRRIIVLNKGKIVVDAAVDEIRALFGRVRTLQFELSGSGAALMPAFTMDGIENISANENTLSFDFETAKYKAPQLIEIAAGLENIVDISIREPTIESIIEKILQGDRNRAY